MKYCENCGKSLKEGQKYCENCGTATESNRETFNRIKRAENLNKRKK
ncbi:zinc-ribbon domain-containing protein [Listeria costaricensis]